MTKEQVKTNKLDKVRDNLLNIGNRWYCFTCNIDVVGLLDRCGVCRDYIPFVPLTFAEFEIWMKTTQMEKATTQQDEKLSR